MTAQAPILTRYVVTAHGRYLGTRKGSRGDVWLSGTAVGVIFECFGDEVYLFTNKEAAKRQAERVNRKGSPCASVREVQFFIGPIPDA